MNNVLKFLEDYKRQLDRTFKPTCKEQTSCSTCPDNEPEEGKCNRL
jgi:hypothetical protein